ncbi:MAG TPA: response regulator transcription factor [Chloroflexota bacterium]|jgi:two-component system alkaline phosphatase synthesis response regulator PhoP|nr:response regulator transcription factor [Chloroflexota bacterium]
MARILIVDDEPNLRHAVGYNLRREGFEVLEAADGETALECARAQRPSLIILDLMLPGMDGLDVCRRLRERSNVPILMLTARDSEVDRVVGLELGADDYLAKPFSMRELVARVKAILRRAELARAAGDTEPDTIEAPGLVIQLRRRRVLVEGVEVTLKPREFDLLAFLARSPGQVFTRSQLLTRVWGYDYAGDTRTVDVHIRSLRTKLGDRVETPRWIETVWGVGYRFREAA